MVSTNGPMVSTNGRVAVFTHRIIFFIFVIVLSYLIFAKIGKNLQKTEPKCRAHSGFADFETIIADFETRPKQADIESRKSNIH